MASVIGGYGSYMGLVAQNRIAQGAKAVELKKEINQELNSIAHDFAKTHIL